MNREIKFRGKRSDNGAWETGSLVVTGQGMSFCKYYIADKMTGYHTPVIKNTIGQFTGLMDRNGREIYEGDIIKINTHYQHIVPFDYPYRYEDEKGFALYVVEWNARHSGMDLVMKNYTKMEPTCQILHVGNHHGIIGNIHDQPELTQPPKRIDG